MTRRDSQRQNVYDAENLLSGIYTNAVEADNPMVDIGGVTLTLPPEARFGSIESVQAYVDKVIGMSTVVDVFGTTERVVVRKRKGVKRAHHARTPRGPEIAMPDTRDRWAMRELIVLHELAHHFDRSLGASHGPHFTSTLLTLLGLVMGPEVELALRLIFDGQGVTIN